MAVGNQIERLLTHTRRTFSGTVGRVARKLDALDIKILTHLQANGRIQKHILAEAVNLSASPCADRVRRLEQQGFIRGYYADIDTSKFLELTHVTVLISLESHRAQDFRRFEAAIAQAEEVQHCEASIGDVDYVLHFVGKSLEHYQSFMEKLLEANVGVQRYAGHVRAKVTKSEGPFPVPRAVAWAKPG